MVASKPSATLCTPCSTYVTYRQLRSSERFALLCKQGVEVVIDELLIRLFSAIREATDKTSELTANII